MPIKTKNGGAYADVLGIKIKQGGVYTAVAGAFVKTAGVYQSVLGAAKPLLFAATQNRATSSVRTYTAGKTKLAARLPFTTGSGAVSEIVLAWLNFAMNGAYNENVSPFTIDELAIENDAGTINSGPIYINGVLPYTLPPGANEITCSAVPATVFGYTSVAGIPRGTKFWVQIRGTISSGLAVPEMLDRAPESNTTKQLFAVYDPTVTTASSAYTLGKPTATGTAFPITGGCFMPIILGRYIEDDVVVPFGLGDSNMVGFTDTAVNYHGKGMMQYALTGDGSPGQLLSGGNFSITGITIQGLYSSPKISAWSKYSTKVIEQAAGNSFSTGGTVTAAQVLAFKQTLWDLIYAASPDASIICTDIGPHTTGAWTLADQSDQVYTNGYAPAGNVEQYRVQMAALAGTAGKFDQWVQFTLWRSGADSLKWVSNDVAGTYTDDGIHGKTNIELSKGAELRPSFFL